MAEKEVVTSSPVKETNGSAKDAAVEEKAAEDANGEGDSVPVKEPAVKENGDAAKEDEEIKENGGSGKT